jgi:hypothetical protein
MIDEFDCRRPSVVIKFKGLLEEVGCIRSDICGDGWLETTRTKLDREFS